MINSKTGVKQPFYQGELVYSIIRSFAHDEQFGINNALPLSETVITALMPVGDSIASQTITDTCYQVLLRFDAAAATQYALLHGIIAIPKRRRKGA